MDKIKEEILRGQEAQKRWFASNFSKSLTTNEIEDEEGMDAETTAGKSEDEASREIKRRSIIKSLEIDTAAEALDILAKAGTEDIFEKAVYADTAENRKLGRVGQEYHKGRKKTKSFDSPKLTNKEQSVVDDFMDKVKTSSSKYSDPTKITVWQTPKGNWEVKYDGHSVSTFRCVGFTKNLAKKVGMTVEE